MNVSDCHLVFWPSGKPAQLSRARRCWSGGDKTAHFKWIRRGQSHQTTWSEHWTNHLLVKTKSASTLLSSSVSKLRILSFALSLCAFQGTPLAPQLPMPTWTNFGHVCHTVFPYVNKSLLHWNVWHLLCGIHARRYMTSEFGRWCLPFGRSSLRNWYRFSRNIIYHGRWELSEVLPN